MDGKEAEHFLERAKELRELASTIKSDDHRALLLDSAEKFERLAKRTVESERKR